MLGVPAPDVSVMRPAHTRDPKPWSDRAIWAHGLSDADTPWWAIAIADLSSIDGGVRVRNAREQGRRLHGANAWDLWGQVVELATERVMQHSLEDWREQCRAECNVSDGRRDWAGGAMSRLMRGAALRSLRAFGQISDLRDDEGFPIVFKDFHVQSVRAMRGSAHAAILLPFEFGKSFLNNIVVPLMDWAEWPDAAEGRIYWNISHSDKWIRRLMAEVAGNEHLHAVFPWVSRPERGDAGWPLGEKPLWGTKGFSIRGRTIADKAFEPLTANQFSTGNRYARVGGDDWVNISNATMVDMQQRLYEYWLTGPETMAQDLQLQSAFGTAWPSVYYCGTLFESYDVGNSIFNLYGELRRKDPSYRALRFDCYVDNDFSRTIWPERKTAAYMAGKRQTLGERVFNMRCRNLLRGASQRVFPRAAVMAAEFDGENRIALEWGQAPRDSFGMVIGFDPGSGHITKESKNPAYFVYCRRDARQELLPGLLRDPILPADARRDPSQPEDIYHHGVEWGRLEGYSFTRQCEFLIALARRYNCPIAVENNATQTAYGDQIKKDAPDIRLFAHRTGPGGADPKQGVEQFEPLFKNERILLHCHGAPLRNVLGLRDELVQWPGRFTDIVMAMWIARRQSEEHFVTEVPQQPIVLRQPSWMRRARVAF